MDTHPLISPSIATSNLFRLRISPEAQWEIRELCVRMLELMVPYAPNVFADLRKELRTEHPDFFEGV